jgi:hypothetical protein
VGAEPGPLTDSALLLDEPWQKQRHLLSLSFQHALNDFSRSRLLFESQSPMCARPGQTRREIVDVFGVSLATLKRSLT